MCLPLSLCPGIFYVQNRDNLFLLNSRGSDLRHLLADKKLQTYNFAASHGIICPRQKAHRYKTAAENANKTDSLLFICTDFS